MNKRQVDFPYFKSLNLNIILLKNYNSPQKAYLLCHSGEDEKYSESVFEQKRSISIPVEIRKHYSTINWYYTSHFGIFFSGYIFFK